MKQLVATMFIGSVFICAVAFGSPALNKTHKGKSVDGTKVNCTYCHKKNNIPKDAKDYAKFKKGAGCAKSGCHK